MKLAMVNPGTQPSFATTEPLNLGFIASYILANSDTEVRIIDQLAGENVEYELKKFAPDIVGITSVTPNFPDAIKVAALSKSMGCLTIMGGVHASILPNEALQYCDIVVKGEGEIAMLKIIEEGIKSGMVQVPYIKDIDTVPPPARHLMQVEFYLKVRDRIGYSFLNFAERGKNTASILSCRGCPYNCAFCHNSWRGIPVRFHSAERMISEIEDLIEQYDVRSIFFIDDNMFVNRRRLERICEMMLERKMDIIWGANSRVDNINERVLRLAKKAGCRQVTFGFESGSQKILNILNKRTTVEQNINAINLCNKVGIGVNGTVMIGNPTETVHDMRKTIKFIRNNKASNGFGVCITTPYPGTKLWDWCVENNRIPEKFEWGDFNYHKIPINCSELDDENLMKMFQNTISAVFEGMRK